MRTVSLKAGLASRGGPCRRFGDGADDFPDERALLRFRLAVKQRRIIGAVPHPFPAEFLSFFDDARIVRADIRVSATVPLTPYFSITSIIRQMPTRTP